MTTIDFLLVAGQLSCWHQVTSDEAWYFLEGIAEELWRRHPQLGWLA